MAKLKEKKLSQEILSLTEYQLKYFTRAIAITVKVFNEELKYENLSVELIRNAVESAKSQNQEY